jgi:hypothetical protein
MSTAHGAGLLLVPGMLSLCMVNTPARGSTAANPLALTLAVIVVHTAAMLVVSGVMANGVCRGLDLIARRLGRRDSHLAP